MKIARRLLGLSFAALMWSCNGDAAAPAPAAPVEVDRVAAHLARVCPCTGEGIQQVELFGDDFMSEAELVTLGNRFVIDLGPEVPQEELPLTLLYRALDDGLASGQKLSLSRATRRADIGRAFLEFAIEGMADAGMLYVIDEAGQRICCKSIISSLTRLGALEPQVDSLATILGRVCPCVGATGNITDAGLIGPRAVFLDRNGNPIDPPLDFGTPIPQNELPIAALYRAIDDGAAEGRKLSVVRTTRRRDLGIQLLLFSVEADMHMARLYVVDEASGTICCKGAVSTYLRSAPGR